MSAIHSSHCRTVFLVPRQLGEVVIALPPEGSDLPVPPTNFIITPEGVDNSGQAEATWTIVN